MERHADVRTRAVQLGVEDDGGIDAALPFHQLAVAIHAQEIARAHLPPEDAEGCHQQRLVVAVADAHVAGELVVVAVRGEDAHEQRQRLSRRIAGHRARPCSMASAAAARAPSSPRSPASIRGRYRRSISQASGPSITS